MSFQLRIDMRYITMSLAERAIDWVICKLVSHTLLTCRDMIYEYANMEICGFTPSEWSYVAVPSHENLDRLWEQFSTTPQ